MRNPFSVQRVDKLLKSVNIWYRDTIRSRFPVSPRLQSGNLPRRYSKAAGSRPIAFRGSKRFETDRALNRLHAWISFTVLLEKRHFSLTPASESAFLTHFQRQARPCSLSVRTKEQRLAPRPRKATKKDALSPNFAKKICFEKKQESNFSPSVKIKNRLICLYAKRTAQGSGPFPHMKRDQSDETTNHQGMERCC